LFEFDHSIRQGSHNLRLWPGECPTSNVTAMERKVRMGREKQASKQSSNQNIEHHVNVSSNPTLLSSLVAD
jgi:hypothetical protein